MRVIDDYYSMSLRPNNDRKVLVKLDSGHEVVGWWCDNVPEEIATPEWMNGGWMLTFHMDVPLSSHSVGWREIPPNVVYPKVWHNK